MPPRFITAGILLFWLAMTGWLVEREVVPMMIADASPIYQIELTDEIGSPLIGWNVFSDGNRIGNATSKIVVNDDRSFELRSTYHFDKFTFGLANIKFMDTKLRVTEDRKLHSFTAQVAGKFVMHDVTLEMRGEVEDQMLQPRLFQDGVELKVIQWGKINMAQQGSIVNPMHLMNRLRGLRAGQTWRIARLDLLGAVNNELVNKLAKQSSAVPSLIAEVKIDTLLWDRRQVTCYKIEYYEPGKDVSARTWVRKIDGLVLQQDANHLGFEMVSRRIPN